MDQYNASDLYMIAYKAVTNTSGLTVTVGEAHKIAAKIVSDYLESVGHVVPSHITAAL